MMTNIRFENYIRYLKKIILQELYDFNPYINCFIAGGSVRNYFSGDNSFTDYDIFFTSVEHFNLTLKYFKDNKANIIYESDNGVKLKYKDKTFDLICKKYFCSPQEAIDNFDFTVSCFAVDLNNVYYNKK